MADPLWRDLLKYSNEGKYGEFVKGFASSLALAMNQVAVESSVREQRAGQEPVRRASTISASSAAGEHVTVLYRQRSTKKPGEWLGRLVLGYEDGEVRIFAASIF